MLQQPVTLPAAVLALGDFAFIDVETTGMDARNDRLTEVAIVRFGASEQAQVWTSLINPGVPIPREIQTLTGITQDMVRDAPPFDAVADKIAALLGNAVFVAHNARFDYGFVKHAYSRLGTRFTADVLCTLRLSRTLFPDVTGHGLDQVIARHGLCAEGRHRALGDAMASAAFVATVCDQFGEARVASVVRSLLRIPSLPSQLPPDALDEVPDCSGVYVFFGINDLPLYVGKARRLRERIRGHFSCDHRTTNDLRLSQELRRIEWYPTAGELSAMVLEARWVKSRQPLYNIALRRRERAVVLALAPNTTAPAFHPIASLTAMLGDEGVGPVWGPFSDRAAARRWLAELSRRQHLCDHALGLGTPKAGVGNPCFARQIGRCLGYCVGIETASEHRRRLIAAAETMQIPRWPFAGPVAVDERDEVHGIERKLVFDQWCLLVDGTPQPFDRDIYRVLRRTLAREPHRFVESGSNGRERGNDDFPA